jgi:hypothetical protein
VDAVVYFADDDNAYDTRIFEEVRATVRISVFPVGLVQEFGISSPIVRVRRSFLFVIYVLSIRLTLHVKAIYCRKKVIKPDHKPKRSRNTKNYICLLMAFSLNSNRLPAWRILSCIFSLFLYFIYSTLFNRSSSAAPQIQS